MRHIITIIITVVVVFVVAGVVAAAVPTTLSTTSMEMMMTMTAMTTTFTTRQDTRRHFGAVVAVAAIDVFVAVAGRRHCNLLETCTIAAVAIVAEFEG